MLRRLRLAVFLLLAPGLARAQVEERPNITVYPVAFFAAYQPTNAHDMVQRLPGFRLEGGDSGIRGFSGTVGNVLIDGDIPTSKEVGVEELLRRIPAGAVDRIELIRAGAAGIDMHGYPLLANVIRNRSATLRGRVELEYAVNAIGLTAPRGALHLTRQGDNDTLDLSLSYGREINGNHGIGFRNRFLAGGAPLRLAAYAQPEQQISAEGSVSYRRDLFGGDINLSGVIRQEVEYSDIVEAIAFPAPLTNLGLERRRDRGLEGQLQYEYPLGPLSHLRLYAIHRSNERDSFSRATTLSGTDNSRSRQSTRESVLRLDGRTEEGMLALEAGAEGAINILNSRNLLERNGALVTLPASNVRVEEKRAEFFFTATWRIAPALTLEASARNEISTIGQSGDTNLSRSLSFFKPHGLLTWRFAPEHELRFLAERVVGQLDFGGFVSSANLVNNNVSAGNQNLQPARTTRLELTWEHRFWQRASVTLSARREFIAGLLDHMPVTLNGRTFDTIGNVGSGRRDMLELSLILPLDNIGLAGVTLTAEGNLNDTRVRDLVTGASRQFSGNEKQEGEIGFSHDLPQWKLRWGGEYDLASSETEYRIDEIDARHNPSRVRLFVEYKPWSDWTIRVFGEELAQIPFTRDRLVYTGLRGSAALDYRELRHLNNGALFGVNLQYNFGL